MLSQKLQLFDGLKKLLLVDTEHSVRLHSVAVESERIRHAIHSPLNHDHAFTKSNKSSEGSPLVQNASVHHARNFLVNAVAISMCMTGFILSMDSLPIIFKVIAFCGSLMVGFIIEIMLNGDEYE